MIRQVYTAKDDSTLPELAEMMIKHSVKRLPVLRDNKATGIVSRADLVAAIAREPAALDQAVTPRPAPAN